MPWQKKKNNQKQTPEKNLRNQRNQNENKSGIFYRKADWAKLFIVKASLSNIWLPHI